MRVAVRCLASRGSSFSAGTYHAARRADPSVVQDQRLDGQAAADERLKFDGALRVYSVVTTGAAGNCGTT